MVTMIFSIFDKKTNVYGRPFFAHNEGHAIRLMDDELRQGEGVMSNHPEDFQLCRIGKFDDSNGALEVDIVRVVIELLSLVVSKEQTS